MKTERKVNCGRIEEDAVLSPSGQESQANEEYLLNWVPSLLEEKCYFNLEVYVIILFPSQHMQTYLAPILAFTGCFYVTVGKKKYK